MTSPTKKGLDSASGCPTYGGASPGQCTEGVRHRKVAQRGGDGWVASAEMLGGHAVAWFLGAQESLSA